MSLILGIRREDKNQWERRVPLIPKHVKELKQNFGIETIIQPSSLRVYSDESYKKIGANVQEDLSKSQTIFAIKEIPIDFFEPEKTYIFFSHTIKGQKYNMPMLRKMMDLKCNLIDYEKIVNEIVLEKSLENYEKTIPGIRNIRSDLLEIFPDKWSNELYIKGLKREISTISKDFAFIGAPLLLD